MQFVLIDRKTQNSVAINAVSVGASAQVFGPWMDVSAYSRVGGMATSDAAVSTTLGIEWSNDGITTHSFDTIKGDTSAKKGGFKEVYAKYARIYVINGDTAAHTMSAYSFLQV